MVCKDTAQQQPAVTIRRVLLGFFVIAGVLLLHGYQFPSTNHALEIPLIQASLNPKLFSRDFFVQEMLGFTPRTYYTYGIVFLMRAGLELTAAYLLTYIVALAAFLAGLVALVRTLAPSLFVAAVFVAWALSTEAGLIAQATIWPPTPIPTAYAMSLATWGLVFSLRGAWPTAYAFFGAACLLQFLVGLMPALLVGPLLLGDTWHTRRWGRAALAAAFMALGAGLVYIPMVMQGTTSTGLFTDEAFVAVYGYWRHSHHMIPSAWPLRAWVQLVLFYAGGTLCVLRARELAAGYRAGLLVVVGMTLIGLLANYLFVEVWPSTLIVKLQLSRMTPFAVLAVLLATAALLYQQWQARRWALCMLLIVLPVSHVPGLMLGLFALFLPLLQRRAEQMWTPPYRWLLIGAAVLLFRWPLGASPPYWAKALAEGPLLLGLLLIPFAVCRVVATKRARLAVATGLALATCTLLAVAASGVLPQRLDRLVAEQVTVRGVWHDDIAVLARRFSAASPEDALVLIPPEAQHFRLLSQRSIVVDFKAFP